MRKLDFDYIIVGAGLAGLSTAYFLVKNGSSKICILEKEAAPGLAASGRSASMICQIVRDPICSQIMIESTQLIMNTWLKDFPEVSFNPSESLHIGKEEDMILFEPSVQQANNMGVKTRWLNYGSSILEYPYLKGISFDRALHCPSDGVINTERLITSLEAYLKQKGVIFVTGVENIPTQRPEGGFIYFRSNRKCYIGRTLINAAGAWADQVSQEVQGQSLNLQPMRRHIFVTKPLDLSKQRPIVWNVSDETYARPCKNGAIILTPCDEEPYIPGPSPVDPKAYEWMNEKMNRFCPDILPVQFRTVWAGLRTFSQDRRFCIGFDELNPNLFWVAGLGGYGVTASARVGQLASELLLNESNVNKNLAMAVSPARFSKNPTSTPYSS